MLQFLQGMLDISIHAPLRGATEQQFMLIEQGKFQSTLPCGERPRRYQA